MFLICMIILEEKKQWILNKIKEYEVSCENKKVYTKLDTVKVGE